MLRSFVLNAAAGMFAIVYLSGTTIAEDVTISLWNAQELFDTDRVEARQADIRTMVNTMKPDVLILDEICSYAVVQEVANIMQEELGTGELHIACSDFNQNDEDTYASFEVGIISRFPLTQVVEFDMTPDNLPGRDNEPSERLLTADSLQKRGIDQVRPGRGFLWARIDALKLTVCATHLKSSRGGWDQVNAMKREYVAASMALSVNEDIAQFPGHSFMIAGDLNVGATDVTKNGTDLDVDIDDENIPGDRYDETHALLAGGLVDGLKMKNLTIGVGETYDSDRFIGTGPIDNIYITGTNENKFQAATKTTSTFGSDHFGISTVYQAP